MYPEVPEEEGDVDDDSEQEGKGEVEDPAGRTRVRDQLLLGEIVSNMPSEGVVVHLFSRNKIIYWTVTLDKIYIEIRRGNMSRIIIMFWEALGWS